MSPATTTLLGAIAALAAHARANPTAAKGIARLREARNRAEAAWLDAGTPDLPADQPKPPPLATFCARTETAEKDWSRVTLDVEVRRSTEKAVLLSDGEREFWCPRSVVPNGDDLANGDVAAVSIPRWVLLEAA